MNDRISVDQLAVTFDENDPMGDCFINGTVKDGCDLTLAVPMLLYLWTACMQEGGTAKEVAARCLDLWLAREVSRCGWPAGRLRRLSGGEWAFECTLGHGCELGVFMKAIVLAQVLRSRRSRGSFEDAVAKCFDEYLANQIR